MTDERNENVKHLEMIQAIVARLASNSFFIKGWTLTVAGAAFGFAANRTDWRVAAIGSGVVLGFWALDSFYLRQERLYRMLYNQVRQDVARGSEARFSMNIEQFQDLRPARRRDVFLSATLRSYYLTLILAGLALAALLGISGAPAPPSPS
jgi:hypothetical protein